MTVILSNAFNKQVKKKDSLYTLDDIPSSPRHPRSVGVNVLAVFQNNTSTYEELNKLYNEFPPEYYNRVDKMISKVYRYFSRKFDHKYNVFRSYSMELHYFSFLAYENAKRKFNLRDAEMNIIFITHYIGKGVNNKDIELTLRLLGQPYTVIRYIPNLIKRGFIYRKKVIKYRNKRQFRLIFTTSQGSEVIKYYSKVISEMIFNYKTEFYARRKAMIYRVKHKK